MASPMGTAWGTRMVLPHAPQFLFVWSMSNPVVHFINGAKLREQGILPEANARGLGSQIVGDNERKQ